MLRNVFLALSVTTALCAPHIVRAEMIADSVSQALMTHPDIKAGQVSVSVAGENVREQRSSRRDC
jgi:outer membrane protein TolC